ncbi:MAG: tetratricopeptide repeat protein [Verrucomicrobiota bacterium]
MKSEIPTHTAATDGPSDNAVSHFGKDLSPSVFRDCLVLLLVLGLIVRAGFLLEHARSPSFAVLTLDQKYYDTVAKMLLSGDDLHQLHGLRPLLYPMFLSVLYKLGGSHGIDLAVIVQHLLGVGTGLLVALLGARLFRHRLSGVAGGVLFLLAPLPLCFEGELLIEPSYTFLICLALLLHLRAAAALGWRSGLLWMLGGALIALAAQARANILVFLAVYPLLAAWRCWRSLAPASELRMSGQGRARSPLRAGTSLAPAPLLPLLGLLGALAMAIPWGLFNMRQTDHFHLIPNAGGVNLYLGNKRSSDGMVPAQERRVTYGERYEDSVEIWSRQEYQAAMRAQGLQPDSDPMAVSKYWTRRALAEIRVAPAAWLHLIAKKSWLTLWNAEVPNNKAFAFLQQEFLWLRLLPVRWVVLLMLAPAGIWAAFKWGNPDALWILLSFAFLYLAANVAFFICDRYRYPVWPVMAAIAGGGLLAFLETLRRQRWRGALCLAAGMALMAAISLPNWFGAQLPNFARDYLFHSIAWYEKGRFPEALGDIDRSLQLDPLDATAWHHRGNVLLALDRFDEARSDYQQTLRLSPDDGGVWNNYAVALDSLGRTNEAYQAFLRATKTQPPSQNAFLSLIFLQLRANDLAAAAATLAQLDKQKSSPSPDAAVLALRSVLARKRGDAPQADALERQARALDPATAAWAIQRATATASPLRPD